MHPARTLRGVAHGQPEPVHDHDPRLELGVPVDVRGERVPDRPRHELRPELKPGLPEEAHHPIGDHELKADLLHRVAASATCTGVARARALPVPVRRLARARRTSPRRSGSSCDPRSRPRASARHADRVAALPALQERDPALELAVLARDVRDRRPSPGGRRGSTGCRRRTWPRRSRPARARPCRTPPPCGSPRRRQGSWPRAPRG